MNAIARDYDVIIAGTGLYGTTLGSILARHGVRVLLIERGTHPRFALGEALLPQSAIWPFVIAQRFGAEDVGHLSHADRIVDHITPTCGLKHSIGFAWQQPGRAVESQHVHQLILPHLPFYSESHLYRQDVDLYMLNAAREQGCDYEDQTDILGVTLDPDRVAVRTDSSEWTAEIFIDSSGGGSRLVQQEGVPKGRSRGAHAQPLDLRPCRGLARDRPVGEIRLGRSTVARRHISPRVPRWMDVGDSVRQLCAFDVEAGERGADAGPACAPRGFVFDAPAGV